MPHVWAGGGLTYYCLTLFFNSTTVHVTEGTLNVKHGPLLWFGKRAVPVREVAQCFVLEKRGNKGRISYELCGLLRDGTRQSLVSGPRDEAAARFLEVRLEQAMNLVDRPVEGETR